MHTLTGIPVYGIGDILGYRDIADVLVLCGGSARDLPTQTPEISRYFNTVDSFDTHADIKKHFGKVDSAARAGGKTAVISAGWDPGLFSLVRLFGAAVLQTPFTYTFWGRGLSQGHSDAVRRIDGVADARQFTVPNEKLTDAVRAGECPVVSPEEMHRRECYVTVRGGADKEYIKNEILNMKNYYSGYETTVEFVPHETLLREYASTAHGGSVLINGKTGQNGENRAFAEFTLKLGSNAEFTACVLLACARAAYRFSKHGEYGCKTLCDIPPKYLLAENENIFDYM